MTAFAPYKIIDTHCHVGLDHIGYSSVPYPGQENVVYCASCLNGKPESVIGYSSDVLPFFHTRLRDLSEFRVMLDTYGSRMTGIGEIEFVEIPYGKEIMPWIDVVLKVQERLGRRLLVTSPWLYKYIVFGSDGDPHALERMKRKLSPLPLYVQEAIFYGNMARELRYV